MALRVVLSAAAAAAALALPSATLAAPRSATFSIKGYEYAFTQTVGSFAGTGRRAGSEHAGWNATVRHAPLGTSTAYVNGGTFQVGTVNTRNVHVDYARGTIVSRSGTIRTVDGGASCTNQRYVVTGRLRDVSTRTTTGGSGSFRVTLTHRRVSLLGHCVIYQASVAGTVSFSY